MCLFQLLNRKTCMNYDNNSLNKLEFLLLLLYFVGFCYWTEQALK